MKHLIQNVQFKRSIALSIMFGLVYFCIHIVINVINTYQKFEIIDITAKQALGPYTISVCSLLLIFSYSTFLSQAMRPLSIIYSDVFYNAFRIFVIAMIVVQVAGHAQIILSDVAKIPPFALEILSILSYITLPLTFLSLFWLETYQDKCFHDAGDRLPKRSMPDQSKHVIIGGCTVGSFGIGLIKPTLQYDYALIIGLETILAILAIWSTTRFYAPLTSRPGANSDEN